MAFHWPSSARCFHGLPPTSHGLPLTSHGLPPPFSGQMLRKGALAQLSATIRMSPTPTHGRCRTSPCNAPCAASQPCCVTSAAATTLERLSDCLTPGSRRAVMSLHPLAIESAHGSAHGSAEGAERRWRRRSSAPLVPSALGRAPSLPM